MRALFVGLSRRRLKLGLSLASIWLAVSCGLSPVEDLPSAVDGLNVDGLDGPFDLGNGSGGSASAGTGGAPNCDVPTGFQCRGSELWLVTVGFTCPADENLVEACTVACITPPGGLPMCAPEGAGGLGGYGGAGAGEP